MIVVTSDVFCDCCQAWIHGVTGIVKDSIHARRKAAVYGWTRKRDPERGMLDVCRDCSGL